MISDTNICESVTVKKKTVLEQAFPALYLLHNIYMYNVQVYTMYINNYPT